MYLSVDGDSASIVLSVDELLALGSMALIGIQNPFAEPDPDAYQATADLQEQIFDKIPDETKVGFILAPHIAHGDTPEKLAAIREEAETRIAESRASRAARADQE